jgi:putative MATE family efflux protein
MIFAGLIPMELLPSLGGMLDAAGATKTRLAMNVTAIAWCLLTEPFLVRALGIEGAALTAVSYSLVGTLVGLVALGAGAAPIRVRLPSLRPDLSMMRKIGQVALPAILQRGLPNLAMSMLLRLVARHGETALAAWVVVTRICNFVMVPAMGLARTTPALVGQNLGAQKPRRAARAAHRVAWLVLLVSLLLFGALAAFAPAVMGLFSVDPGTIRLGARVIRLVSLGYAALSLYYVFDGVLSGAGDTVSPMIVNVLALWGVQIPLAFVLSRFTPLGVDGIWLALVLGWLLQAGLVGWRVWQGAWQEQRV